MSEGGELEKPGARAFEVLWRHFEDNAMTVGDDLAEALDDLAWLAEQGALTGVSEVLRERRRQVEHGHTVEHDDVLPTALVSMASTEVSRVRRSRGTGTADLGSDEDALRKAAALLAAEMDRLFRLGSGTAPG